MSQIGNIALASPPTQTNAGSDTVLTFSAKISQLTVQNNTSAGVNISFDGAASAGSFLIPSGSTFTIDKQCSAVHLYTASAQNINGTSANNIVVLGEAV